MSSRSLFQMERLQAFFSEGVGTQILITTLVILGAVTIVISLRRLLARYIEDMDRRYRASKLIGRLFGIVTIFVILYVWTAGQAAQMAVTLLMVIGAGLAIAMREVLLSSAAWINIVLRSPYNRGDRIEINGIRGDVIDIHLLHSSMMEIGQWVDADQSTGRVVRFPNAWLFQYAMYNYTRGFRYIWNEIPLTITFQSDWQAAREIMLEMASESNEIVEKQVTPEMKAMSKIYMVHYSSMAPFIYVRLTQGGIVLTLRYLTEARKRRGTEHALTMGILHAFHEHGGIELAYHTVGVFPVGTTPPGQSPVDAPPSQ